MFQTLLKLQDKVVSLSDVCKVWNDEANKYVIDIDDSNADGMETDDPSPNYLLAVTQVLSFYLTHLTEKYFATDVNIESMLNKIGGKCLISDLKLIFCKKNVHACTQARNRGGDDNKSHIIVF